MAHNTLAPWAEIVQDGQGPLTADELLTLPENGWQYELVEGRLVRMSPTGLEHLDITERLLDALKSHVVSRSLGRVTLPETGFKLPRPGADDTVLAPDVALVSRAKLQNLPAPGTPERKRFLPVVPDLAAEVASPGQYRPEMADKVRFYLESGVPLVWIVWPPSRQVDVWRPGAQQPIATLGVGDALDGLEVVPGFTFPVADLFL